MRHWSRRRGLFFKSEARRLPDLGTSILLFVAGCASWIIGIFSGGGGSIVLLADYQSHSGKDNRACDYDYQLNGRPDANFGFVEAY